MASMNDRHRAAFTALLLCIFAGAASCGEILSDDEDPSDTPSAPEAGIPDGPGGADVVPEGGGRPDAGACNRTPAPTCAPTECLRHTLYEPESPEQRGAPWDLATDEDFVYWLEQPATEEGHNGHGDARVLRASKAPSTASPVVLATGQARAIALTVAEGWVYWATHVTPDGGGKGSTKLVRVPADCQAPCAPDEFPLFADAPPIWKLLATGPGELHGLSGDGRLFRFTVHDSKVEVAGPLLGVGPYPAMARAGGDLLVSAGLHATIARIDLHTTKVDPGFIPLPSSTEHDPGVTNMWTDCVDVWARRGPQTDLLRISLANRSVTTVASDLPLSVYDLAGDDRYLWIASPAGGLHVLDRSAAPTEPVWVAGSRVFRVAVDDDGVYWGEHDTKAPSMGTISMLFR